MSSAISAPQINTSEIHVKSLSRLFSRSVMSTPQDFAEAQKKQAQQQKQQVFEAKSQATNFRASLRGAFLSIVPRGLRRSNSNSSRNGPVSPSASALVKSERLSQPGFAQKASANPLFADTPAITEEVAAPTQDVEDVADALMPRPVQKNINAAPTSDIEDVADQPMSRPLRQMSADQWVNDKADVEDVVDTIIHAPISFEIAGVGPEVNNYINARAVSTTKNCTLPQSSEAIGDEKAQMRKAMGNGEYSRVLELAQTIASELARLGSATEALEYYFIALSYSTREGLPKCYRDIFETMGAPSIMGSGRRNSGQRNQFLTLSEAVST